MDIAISGASGLIGSALHSSLARGGHRPISLVRRDPRPHRDEIRWDPATGAIDAAGLEGIDAVVHLAGAGIGDKRWTDARKDLLRDSRVDGTRLIAATLAELKRQPQVLIRGSAVGFYGNRGDEELIETSERGTGFLADLVSDWERAASPALEGGICTSFARTGVVMTSRGGALKKQLLMFKLGLGGRFGSGDQWLSWISLRDHVRALEYLIANRIAGPVNLTAPHPVTNHNFTKTLGHVLNRPTLLPVPLVGPRLLFGKKLVDELLLGSQRVLPWLLTDRGFSFEDETLESCLEETLRK